MRFEELERRRVTAEAIARDAGNYLRRQFANLDTLTIEVKGRQDFVSEADRTVELQIRKALGDAFPGEKFLGEESGGQATEPVWVVDPIDGTTNFLRGIPMFAISIAWVAEGSTQVGVIYEPITDKMYSATQLGAATLNASRLQVRPCERIDAAIVAFGYSERSGIEPFLERFSRVLRAQSEFRRLGAATIGLTAVACGQVDAFFQLHLDPWDVLAGLLIVERSGGIIHNFLDNNGLRHGNVCFCATPGIADALHELLDVASLTSHSAL
ncbi:MAG: inositol monophosphatase [Myxococcales bacterium]|nr:inositol monophosphatase [Myxococcales bacterium]